jgi:anthranilate synthase component 1
MVIPDFAAFRQMAEQANVVPVYREILGDLETPVSAYKKLRDQGPSYLLESVEGGEKWGRFSFLGFNPSLILECREGRVVLKRRGATEELPQEVDPFQHVRQVLKGFQAAAAPGLPRFWGGLVGYLGYDMVRYIERLPELTPAIAMPEARFLLADHLLIFDNLRQTIKVVALAHLTPELSLKHQYNQTVAEIHDIIERLRQPVPHDANAPRVAGQGLSANLTQEEFEAIVLKGKEYITAGDVIQVVLSQCFTTPLGRDPLDLYRALRCINPSPYMFFLDTGDLQLVGASPEVLVRLEENHIIYRPIAGTRPRGATPEEDQTLETDLLADPKERAEHIMLVDLGRNDVGRVSTIGTVRVPELFTVERYSHVMHLVSQVEGELAQGTGHGDHRGVGAHPPGALRRCSGVPGLQRQPGLLHHHPEFHRPQRAGLPAGGRRHCGRLGPGPGIPGDRKQGHGPHEGPGTGGGGVVVREDRDIWGRGLKTDGPYPHPQSLVLLFTGRVGAGGPAFSGNLKGWEEGRELRCPALPPSR